MIAVSDFYASLVESSDDAIVAKDTDGIVIAWNPAAERLFGYSAEEMEGQSVRILLPEHRQHEEDEILERIRKGERVGQFFTERLHKDGHLLQVSVTVSPVRNAEGTIIGASKIARDAGPYLRDQERLRQSEERFRMMADNISQLAWIAEADGDINWYNQRWYDYTGTTFDEMRGWGWKSVHDPDHVERVVARFQHSLTTTEEWEDIFPLRGADGEYRWFLSRAKPIFDDKGNIACWFGTNTDITEQREQSEQIRLLLMEVNHRAKNMLGTVQALARQSARGGAGDFVDRFEKRVRSLSLNQDILVRREWKEVPMRELVDAQRSFVENSHGEMEIDGPEVCVAPGAAEVLGMALHELATNAIKYGALSVETGTVTISWDVDQEGHLLLEWKETGGPPVEKPERQGFGTTLIRDIPQRHFAEELELDYRSEGVVWKVRCAPDAIAAMPRRVA